MATGSRKAPALARDTSMTVPAVARTLDILEHLSQQSEGLTLSELSTALCLPKNTTSRILGTLQSRGYVLRDRLHRRFSLTRKFFMLAQPGVGDVSLAAAAMAPMRQLRDRTKETVQLGIRIGNEGIIIDKVEALHPLRISVDVGLRFLLHNNAPGKLMLAFEQADQREATLKKLELTPTTSRTLTTPQALRAECEAIHAQGYAVDHGEADEGIHCIAAPILNPQQELLAALWVSAPSRRLPQPMFSAMAKWVAAAAREASQNLRH